MIILLSIIILLRFQRPVWYHCEILSWDVFGYYLYLPSYFIYHDLGLKDMGFINHIFETYNPSGSFYQAFAVPDHNWVMKYPMGLAILYSPFFFIGQFIAKIGNYPMDGFSIPYQASIAIGGLIYTIIGLIYFRKILLRFFNDRIVSILLICIVLGTNYLDLTYFSGTMPHNYLFAIYALVIWLTIKWHDSPKIKYIIFLGLLIGLAGLIRPTEIICFIIPLFWTVDGKKTLIEKWHLLKKHKLQILVLIICVFLMASFQMIYWKIYTGKFIYWSYGDEGFNFSNPYFSKVLFSYKKGWLIYTPIMIFAIIGFWFIYKYKKSLFYPLFIYFIINLWIVSSWDCWWYGGSYGQRALMQSYVVMAFPMGFYFMKIFSLKKIIKYPLLLIGMLVIFLNLFQTWQVAHYIIDPSRMTKNYYWKIFLKTKSTEEDRKMLEVERSTSAEEKIDNEANYYKMILSEESFEFKEKDRAQNYCDTISHSGKISFVLDSTCNFSPAFSEKYSNITCKEYIWIRASIYIYPIYNLKNNPVSIIINFDHKGKSIKYRGLDLEKLDLKLNEWNLVTFDYQSPEIISDDEKIYTYVWLRGKKKVFIDDFNIVGFIPKN
jgi:hypothetical protein